MVRERFPWTSRRRFLQGGVSASVGRLLYDRSWETDDSRAETRLREAEEEITIAGRVVDIESEPVAEARVTCYDRFTTETVRETTTDMEGEFKVELPAGVELYMVITATDEDGRTWFRVEHGPAREEFWGDEEFEWVLSRQLVFGPAQALTDEELDDDEDELVYGVVSVWRWINSDEPTDQILYLEITQTSPNPYGEPWGITRDGDDPDASPDITHALPSVIIPQTSVHAAYSQLEGFETFPDPTDVVSVWENVPHINTDAGALSELFLESWHPLREPELPAFAFSRRGSQEVQYRQYRDSDLEEFFGPEVNDEMDEEAVLREAGLRGLQLLPYVGNVLTLGDTLSWASDIIGGYVFGTESYPTSTELVADVPGPDRNTQNLVSSPWEGRSASVVLQVPLRFRPEQMDTNSVEIIVEAVWEKRVVESFSPLQPEGRIGRFAQGLSLGPEPQAIETGEDVEDGTTNTSGDRWLPWVPDPRSLNFSRLSVNYWDYVSIRETIELETGASPRDIEYDSFPGAASPYAFVDFNMDHELLQVSSVDSLDGVRRPYNPRTDGDIIYEIIIGSFSETEAQTKLEETDLDHDEYNGYSLFYSDEYAVGISDEAIILPATHDVPIDEQLNVIRTIINTERGENERYQEVNSDYETLSNLFIDHVPHIQNLILDIKGWDMIQMEESELDDPLRHIVGRGRNLHFTSGGWMDTSYFLFDHESDVNVEALQEVWPPGGMPVVETEYQVMGRGVIVETAILTLEDEPLSFPYPHSIGFRECNFVRPEAQAKYDIQSTTDDC